MINALLFNKDISLAITDVNVTDTVTSVRRILVVTVTVRTTQSHQNAKTKKAKDHVMN